MNRNELYHAFVDRYREGNANEAKDSDISDLEQTLRISLPSSYRTFIKSYGAMKTPSIAALTFNEDDGMIMWDVLEFIPFPEVARLALQPVPNGMPEDLLAYANDSMGNLFCLKRSLMAEASDDTSVWFFDHEFCDTEKLSDSFDSWLLEFVKLEEQK